MDYINFILKIKTILHFKNNFKIKYQFLTWIYKNCKWVNS